MIGFGLLCQRLSSLLSLLALLVGLLVLGLLAHGRVNGDTFGGGSGGGVGISRGGGGGGSLFGFGSHGDDGVGGRSSSDR